MVPFNCVLNAILLDFFLHFCIKFFMEINKTLESIKNLVCNTPMVEVLVDFEGSVFKVFAKCEWYSLTGSIKDRVAYQIFCDALKAGRLKKGDKIVEVTSGNMGISLTAVGHLLGFDVTIIMPKNMSNERKQLLALYGAHLIETKNFDEAFEVCKQYKARGYFCTEQFANKSNATAHHNFTAKEIYKKLKNKNVKTFVAGVGTAGTLCGAGAYLKKHNFEVIGVEPANARILTGKKPFAKHKLQGLSDGHLPDLYQKNLVDGVIQIGDDDAVAMAQKLSRELSLGVGVSSGANFLASVLCKKNCVTVLPDDNKKYLSKPFNKQYFTPLVDKIKFVGFKVL